MINTKGWTNEWIDRKTGWIKIANGQMDRRQMEDRGMVGHLDKEQTK